MSNHTTTQVTELVVNELWATAALTVSDLTTDEKTRLMTAISDAIEAGEADTDAVSVAVELLLDGAL